ncbi:hypothetical protein D3C71_1738320 [compost metagenome]
MFENVARLSSKSRCGGTPVARATSRTEKVRLSTYCDALLSTCRNLTSMSWSVTATSPAFCGPRNKRFQSARYFSLSSGATLPLAVRTVAGWALFSQNRAANSDVATAEASASRMK